MKRSLDQKLAAIRANPGAGGNFILADAKDADMAFGVRAPGPRGYLAEAGAQPARFSPEIWSREEYGYRNLPEFLDIIREVTRQGLVDIMLMSAYVTDQTMSYDGSAGRRATAHIRNNPLAGAGHDWPRRGDGTPDFERMTSAHRLAFDRARMKY